jgi:hypothetical protein
MPWARYKRHCCASASESNPDRAIAKTDRIPPRGRQAIPQRPGVLAQVSMAGLRSPDQNSDHSIRVARMNRMTAKIFCRCVTDMVCANFAPHGTVMKVPITIPTNAGT